MHKDCSVHGSSSAVGQFWGINSKGQSNERKGKISEQEWESIVQSPMLAGLAITAADPSGGNRAREVLITNAAGVELFLNGLADY